MTKKEHEIEELGGSCIIPSVCKSRRDTDWDGYNDYQSVTIINKNEDYD